MDEKASLIEDREAVLDTGAIIQIRIWRLPRATSERPHGSEIFIILRQAG
jgi:hypothetical protein